jgi:imidazolonepropionase-like amidohydrolase
MTRTILVLLVALPTLLTAQGPQRAAAVVLNRITVIDVAGSTARRDMAVVIRGSRIAAVGRAGEIEIPQGAEVIDLSGKFLIPGLIDMHNHLGPAEIIPGPPGPGGPPPRGNTRSYLTRMLAMGFTAAFATSHADLREHAELRRSASDHEAPIARYFGVGRGSSTPGGHAGEPRFGGYLPSTPDEARANVRELASVGVDAVKLTYSDQAHTGRRPLSVMRADIMQAMIAEAHVLGLKAVVHAPTLRHAKEVLRAGADGLVHSVADAPVDDEFIGLMRKNGATYTTTLALYTSFTDVSAWMRRLMAADHRKVVSASVYDRYLGPEGARAYHAFFGTFPPENLGHAKTNARRIFDAGLPVLAGTDTGVTGVLLGVSSQVELELLVEAGLTAAQALRTATLNPARALGREIDFGAVEPNRVADLVVLDADALSDIRNITRVHRVIKGGVVHDPGQLLATITK